MHGTISSEAEGGTVEVFGNVTQPPAPVERISAA
jgi:hypothetical protein